MFLGKKQHHHHRRDAGNEKRLSVQLVRESDEIHEERTVRNVLDPPTAEGKHMLYSEDQMVKQHVGLLCIRATQGHSGANIQPNFFSQEILEQGYATEL